MGGIFKGKRGAIDCQEFACQPLLNLTAVVQENYSVEIVPNVEEDTGPRTWKELATEKGFDFSGMTDDAVYRQQVIFEIIKTEADYCQVL